MTGFFIDHLWLVPVLPLFGALAILVLGRRLGEPKSGWLASFMTIGSFLITVAVFFNLLSRPAEERHQVVTMFKWIPVGSLQVDMALLADPLSITMALFITGIGSLIHLYAIGYMHGDPKFPKFFLYLNLFVFSMLMLVLGENLLVTFLGWEGVGACSYFLISFWHTRDSAAVAGKKAFVAGADIDAYRTMSAKDFREFIVEAGKIANRIYEIPKPFIAAIYGYALGGGLELALHCDLVVANKSAKLGLPEANLGLLPGGGGTQIVPRLIGVAKANDMIMRGRWLRGEEALNCGLISSVFDDEKYEEELAEYGVIFCSITEAIKDYPDLIKKYLGSVVPIGDNYFSALNSAVFTDGSFCYIPKGVRCPMELSTYFRINEGGTGQFERTLVVADEGAYVSYLEGCTAPQRDENQLHAAVVELIAMDHAEIKYSTVQNWYPGDKEGKGGIFNFVTKRGMCDAHAKISWTQVETGSAVTWKYPSCILKGDYSIGEFYSVAVTNNYQQADTGTKMIHLGKNTKSTIISKGISAGKSQNSYRGLVQINKSAQNARNFSQCDSLLMTDECGAHTFPYIECKNPTAKIEHEATTSKIGEDQLFYCMQRGISEEKAISLIVNGYCKEVLNQLPMEFAVEAQKLLAISLEGSVG